MSSGVSCRCWVASAVSVPANETLPPSRVAPARPAERRRKSRLSVHMGRDCNRRRESTPQSDSCGFVSLLCCAGANPQQSLRWGADPSGGAPYVFNVSNHPDQYIGYEKDIVDV